MENDGDGGSDDGPALQPSLSARVLLEIAVLAADTVESAALPTPAGETDARKRTVLVAAGDSDIRRYVTDCLRTRSDLQVVQAGSTAAMLDAIAVKQPHLFIVDESLVTVLLDFPSVPAILLADEIPELVRDRSAPATPIVLMSGPFQARGLLEQVNRFIGRTLPP